MQAKLVLVIDYPERTHCLRLSLSLQVTAYAC